MLTQRKGREDNNLGKDDPDKNAGHSGGQGERLCVSPFTPTFTPSARDIVKYLGKKGRKEPSAGIKGKNYHCLAVKLFDIFF